MIVAVQISCPPNLDELSDVLRPVAEAGFGGVELQFGPDDTAGHERPASGFRRLGALASELRLDVVALSWVAAQSNRLGSRESSQRESAARCVLTMLDGAVAAGARAIVVPLLIASESGTGPRRCASSDAFSRAAEMLLTLRHVAEARGVQIACEVSEGTLLSATEAADLVDFVNSPHVGWCLDAGAARCGAFVPEWILTLGGRLRHVRRVPAGPSRSTPDASAADDVLRDLVLALHETRYDGALTIEPCENLLESARRSKRLLAADPDALYGPHA